VPYSSVFHSWLQSDELQFASKKGRGCREAIFTLRTHITSNSNSSTATLCALDVAKAFDKTNHFGLYMKLMDRRNPLPFLNVLINWYSTVTVLHMYAGVALSQVHSRYLQVLGRVEFFSPHFMLYLLIQSLVNYELQVLVLIGQLFFGCLL